MAQAVRKVDVINIDCDSSYFDTKEQINLRSKFHFSDRYAPAKIYGSYVASGFFSNSKKKHEKSSGGDLYPLQGTVTDASGNSRKILSLSIDTFTSGAVDAYKNGVEILQEKHWIAGVAKISAGTPGHLRDIDRYGIPTTETFEYLNVPNTSSIDSSGAQRKFLTGDAKDLSFTDNSGNQRRIFLDGRPSSVYTEIDVFDPVKYVALGGDPSSFTYPIITKNSNEAENSILDGIIEPFPIRSVISNMSINFPFEPHATRGQYGNGNHDPGFASDSVVSVDYTATNSSNKAFFLDAVDRLGVSADPTTMVTLGVYNGYINPGRNVMPSYKEEFNPRGESVSGYDVDLRAALQQFKQGGTTYISKLEKSATCGHTFETNGQGTDSVAYGDMTYGVNRDNRRRKRTIISLRDASPFVKNNNGFNDTDTINYVVQVLEYPSMLPINYSGSMMNDVVRSEVYKVGAIQLTGSLKPGIYDLVLSDSILSAQKRAGDF